MAIDPAVIDTINGGSAAKTTKTNVQEISDRFMKLLTTQLRNQDPTNPLDNAQMTSQLAQMSTVEGINKLNDSIGSLLAGYKSSQTMQAASMIGRQVLVDGDVIGLNKSLGGGAIELKGATDKTVIHIYDDKGNEVRTLDMGSQKAGVQAFIWDGLDNGGQQLADGSYTYKVDASKGGKAVDVTSLSLAGVSSVVVNDSGIELQTVELGTRQMGQVRQIY